MRTRTVLLWIAALAAGAAILWIDSRPTWDDTGITAGLLLLTSAGFGMAEPRQPWRWGLAIGAWIPVMQLLKSWQPMALVILAIAMVGAHVGSLLRGTTATASS
jgi:hypothetical protein